MPNQLPNVFSDDYNYFESNHQLHPEPAAAVFECVSDLRVALNAFREATLESKRASEPTDIVEVSSVFHAADHNAEIEIISDGAAEPATLLEAVGGSVDAEVIAM